VDASRVREGGRTFPDSHSRAAHPSLLYRSCLRALRGGTAQAEDRGVSSSLTSTIEGVHTLTPIQVGMLMTLISALLGVGYLLNVLLREE
jgi:hypothetical protein